MKERIEYLTSDERDAQAAAVVLTGATERPDGYLTGRLPNGARVEIPAWRVLWREPLARLRLDVAVRSLMLAAIVALAALAGYLTAGRLAEVRGPTACPAEDEVIAPVDYPTTYRCVHLDALDR